MSFIQRLAAMLAICTCSCGAANAALITNLVDPTPNAYVSLLTPYTYTHDLRDQLVPGSVVNSANLQVSLYDLTDILFPLPETISFGFDGTQAARSRMSPSAVRTIPSVSPPPCSTMASSPSPSRPAAPRAWDGCASCRRTWCSGSPC